MKKVFNEYYLKAEAKIKRNGLRSYYWTGEKNFGDLVTPYLIRKIGFTPIPSPASIAQVVLCGSNLDVLPPRFKGIIAGGGYIEDGPKHNLPHATALLVRGPQSKERLNAKGVPVLGDPGLILPKFIRKSQLVNGRIGVVPHHSEVGLSDLENAVQNKKDLAWISPIQSVEKAVEEITRCDCVLSSSLHGLITADAFSIPSAWIQFSKSSKRDSFKYNDYFGSVNINRNPQLISSRRDIYNVACSKSEKASPETISKLKENISSTLREVKHVYSK